MKTKEEWAKEAFKKIEVACVTCMADECRAEGEKAILEALEAYAEDVARKRMTPEPSKEPMAFNSSDNFEYGEEIKDSSLEGILWKLLDDIDTASDMFKPSTIKSYNNYYKYITKKVGQRFKHITSDGYKLYKVKV